MDDACGLSESDAVELKSLLEKDYKEELHDLPHVLELIHKLHDYIKRQRKKINKVQNKLTEYKKQKLIIDEQLFVDCETQTESAGCEEDSFLSQIWKTDELGKTENIVDQVKQTAESTLQQNGFVYEETSGLYYDYSTGYYYDAAQGLYYDGNSGTYYSYDETSKSYNFHSQAEVIVNKAAIHQQKIDKRERKRSNKANKDEAKKRKLAQEGGYSEHDEPEEGECSDSDYSRGIREITPELASSNESENEDEQDLAKTYPPCMRIIVKETGLPKLKVGSLFLVAYTGGSIGREGDHSVLIPDISISKYHARLQYDEDEKHYQIIDSGSRNGTFLNGKRLSVAKQESAPHEIIHGSIVQVGSTKLLCHIHNGYETCGYCEPGLIQQNVIYEGNAISKKEQHKSELRRLKHKFGVEKNNVAASQLAIGYQDRAQARRDCVGSSNHHVKTQQSSLDTSIAKDNKGFKLLSKMGWAEGQSLGKDGSGRTEPVPLICNPHKAGFGTLEADISTFDVDPSTEKKQAVWRKTQQRFQEIQN